MVNDQKRAGTIKIWLDNQYTNLFIVKKEEIFWPVDPSEIFVSFTVQRGRSRDRRSNSP
jgi:hypothetical protein